MVETSESDPRAMLQELEGFQVAYEEYAEGILDKDQRLEPDELAELRKPLQQAEPSVTAVIIEVIGDKTLDVGVLGTTSWCCPVTMWRLHINWRLSPRTCAMGSRRPTEHSQTALRFLANSREILRLRSGPKRIDG